MTRIVIKRLVWNSWNRRHIKKHNVTEAEVEEAVKHLIAHKLGKNGKFIAIGRSGARIIAAVLGRDAPTTYYVITARDANQDERSRVYEKESK